MDKPGTGQIQPRTPRYECQGCGAVSELVSDVVARLCRVCGLHEVEARAALVRLVQAARGHRAA